MTLEFMDELEVAVGDIAKDDSIRAVIITGAGDDNFSAGMDLKQLVPKLQDRSAVDEVLDQRLRVLDAIENMGKSWRDFVWLLSRRRIGITARMPF